MSADQSSFISFIKEYGTLIIAVYGVIQLWLGWIWKNFIWKGKVSIFETGRIEIGYGNFAETVGLNGTLRAQRKEVFVNNISLTIIKERDSSTHKFEWVAFRSSQLRMTPTDTIKLELPVGFNILPEQPYRYNIFFCDRKTQNELIEDLSAVQISQKS